MPKEAKTRRRRLVNRLIKHYRLVIVNDDTLKTEASLKLNLLNLILLSSSLLVVFAAIIFTLIGFTPVRELLPGYESGYSSKQQLVEYRRLTDSILHQVDMDKNYYGSILAILKDSVPGDLAPYRPLEAGTTPDIAVPIDDSTLRAEMEQVASYGILLGQDKKTSRFLEEINFFCPLRGPVTEGFGLTQNHFGVDIVAAENTAIKAALEGKVIMAGWSSTDGYFVIIQHANNLTSIYKHNSTLMARTGDRVRAGDVIAIIGNSGEFSRGIHLHFELWYNMVPVDPLLYISFS